MRERERRKKKKYGETLRRCRRLRVYKISSECLAPNRDMRIFWMERVDERERETIASISSRAHDERYARATYTYTYTHKHTHTYSVIVWPLATQFSRTNRIYHRRVCVVFVVVKRRRFFPRGGKRRRGRRRARSCFKGKSRIYRRCNRDESSETGSRLLALIAVLITVSSTSKDIFFARVWTQTAQDVPKITPGLSWKLFQMSWAHPGLSRNVALSYREIVIQFALRFHRPAESSISRITIFQS